MRLKWRKIIATWRGGGIYSKNTLDDSDLVIAYGNRRRTHKQSIPMDGKGMGERKEEEEEDSSSIGIIIWYNKVN